MRASNSQLLKAMKASYFKTMDQNEDALKNTYSKTKDRMSMLEFELEHNRDIIIHLRADLASKEKEISLLKVDKNKKNDEYQKLIRIIEEILKQCDQSTKSGFKTIENSILNDDLNNNNTTSENNNSNSVKKNKNKKYKTKLPQIGNMLHFTTKHKKTMKEIVYVDKLKNHITDLNEELAKRDEKIIELKKYQNSTNYSKLQNNFIKNYNELAQVKKENEFMKTKIEDVHHLLVNEKEDNINLKNKLQDFQNNFRFYKDNSIKKTNALENMLAKMRTKERECKIFHVRKGTSAINKKKGDLNEGENDSNAYEEIKKMNKTMTQLRISQNNKDNQIKTLKEEKKNLLEEIKKRDNDKKLLLQNLETLNKKLEESDTKRKNVEKNIKDQAIDANKIIENLEKENKELKNELVGKESLIDEEKSKTNAIKELLKEQEEENIKLNKKISELVNKCWNKKNPT